MGVATALSRILAGTAADYRQADAETFEIVRRKPPRTIVGAIRTQTPNGADASEIIVTGSKSSAVLSNYIGSVALVDGTSIRSDARIHGSDALVDQAPILPSTHLGPARNKLSSAAPRI